MKRIAFKDPAFHLFCSTDVEKSIHSYEIRWGYFDVEKPYYEVLGEGSSNKFDKDSVNDWFDKFHAAKALVQSTGGTIEGQFKQTKIEAKLEEEARKKDEERRAKENRELEKASAGAL